MEGEQLNIHRDLIEGSQKGDLKAQAQLYKLYAGAMYNICRRMLRDDEEAKDILQESFIHTFDKLDGLREINTFSSWIKRIVVNNCINTIRKRKLMTTELKEEWDWQEEEYDDFEYTRHQSQAIMEAVELLPLGCKTVLNLYLFEGYDHKEIGQILGVTESASKAQYCKAKSRIRKMLEENRHQYAG